MFRDESIQTAGGGQLASSSEGSGGKPVAGMEAGSGGKPVAGMEASSSQLVQVDSSPQDQGGDMYGSCWFGVNSGA